MKKGRNKVRKRKVMPSKKLGGALGGRKMKIVKRAIIRKLSGK